MTRVLHLVAGLAALCLATTAIAGERTLKLGVMPYTDPGRLAVLHYPFKSFLARTLGARFRLVSAPDMEIFVQRTQQKRYDVLLTAPHLGRRAETDNGYHWLGFARNDSRALFVAAADGRVTSIDRLRGRTIALPPRQTLVHQLALDVFMEHGITPHIDVYISVEDNDLDAALSAANGDTDAAAIDSALWQHLPTGTTGVLRQIGRSEAVPGYALLVSDALDADARQRLVEALPVFMQSKQGALYLKKSGLNGIRASNEQDTQQLDRLLNAIAEPAYLR